jgi:hypothetical protein
MACSCAAVEHHARIGRATEFSVQASDNLRAAVLRGPAHWQSTLLKSGL